MPQAVGVLGKNKVAKEKLTTETPGGAKKIK